MADGSRFDPGRIFADVPAMQEAGVTEFATGVTGRLEGSCGWMAAIERHIGAVAEYAARCRWPVRAATRHCVRLSPLL